jgi:hypothetical protein
MGCIVTASRTVPVISPYAVWHAAGSEHAKTRIVSFPIRQLY